MKTIYSISAWVLFIGAVAGLVFSIFGLITFWKSEKEILYQVTSSIELVDQALSTTSSGFNIVHDAIIKAKDDISLIEDFTYEISDAVGNTRPTLETVSELFGQNLNDILIETQISLQSAQSSAVLIDDTLKIISSIPFVGTRYAPSQPLGDSIGQISTSLEELPETFSEIEDGLASTAEDLYGIETSIDNLAERIGEIDQNLDEADTIITDYESIAGKLIVNIRSINNNMPKWFRGISYGISALFAWIGIASLGLFSIGTLMLKLNTVQNTSAIDSA